MLVGKREHVPEPGDRPGKDARQTFVVGFVERPEDDDAQWIPPSHREKQHDRQQQQQRENEEGDVSVARIRTSPSSFRVAPLASTAGLAAATNQWLVNREAATPPSHAPKSVRTQMTAIKVFTPTPMRRQRREVREVVWISAASERPPTLVAGESNESISPCIARPDTHFARPTHASPLGLLRA